MASSSAAAPVPMDQAPAVRLSTEEQIAQVKKDLETSDSRLKFLAAEAAAHQKAAHNPRCVIDQEPLRKFINDDFVDTREYYKRKQKQCTQQFKDYLQEPLQLRSTCPPLSAGVHVQHERHIYYNSPKTHPLFAAYRYYNVINNVGHRHPGDADSATGKLLLHPTHDSHANEQQCISALEKLISGPDGYERFVSISCCSVMAKDQFESQSSDNRLVYDVTSPELKSTFDRILGDGEKIPVITYENETSAAGVITPVRKIRHLYGGRDAMLQRCPDYEEDSPVAQVIAIHNAAGDAVIFDLGQSHAPRLALLLLLADSSVVKVFAEDCDLRTAICNALLTPFDHFEGHAFYQLDGIWNDRLFSYPNTPSYLDHHDAILHHRADLATYPKPLSSAVRTYFHSAGWPEIDDALIHTLSSYYVETDTRNPTIAPLIKVNGPGYQIARYRSLLTMDITIAMTCMDAQHRYLIPNPDIAEKITQQLGRPSIPESLYLAARNSSKLPEGWVCKYDAYCIHPHLTTLSTQEAANYNRTDATRRHTAENDRKILLERLSLLEAQKKREEETAQRRDARDRNRGRDPSHRRDPSNRRDRDRDSSSGHSEHRRITGSKPSILKTPASHPIQPIQPSLPLASSSQPQPMEIQTAAPAPSFSSSIPVTASSTQFVSPITAQADPALETALQQVRSTDPQPTHPVLYHRWIQLRRAEMPAIFHLRGTLSNAELIALDAEDWSQFQNLEDIIPTYPMDGTLAGHLLVPIPIIDISRSAYRDLLGSDPSLESDILWNYKCAYLAAYKKLLRTRPWSSCASMYSALAIDAFLAVQQACQYMLAHGPHIFNEERVAALMLEFYLFVKRSTRLPTGSEHNTLRGYTAEECAMFQMSNDLQQQTAARATLNKFVLMDVVFTPDHSRLIITSYDAWVRPVLTQLIPLPPTDPTFNFAAIWQLRDYTQSSAPLFSIYFTPKRLLESLTRPELTDLQQFAAMHPQDNRLPGLWRPPIFVRKFYPLPYDSVIDSLPIDADHSLAATQYVPTFPRSRSASSNTIRSGDNALSQTDSRLSASGSTAQTTGQDGTPMDMSNPLSTQDPLQIPPPFVADNKPLVSGSRHASTASTASMSSSNHFGTKQPLPLDADANSNESSARSISDTLAEAHNQNANTSAQVPSSNSGAQSHRQRRKNAQPFRVSPADQNLPPSHSRSPSPTGF